MSLRLWENANVTEQRNVLDALPVLVFLERAGNIVFANSVALQVTGVAEAEWLNRPIEEVIWGLSAGRAEPQTSLMSMKGRPFHATLSTKGGCMVPVEGTYQTLHAERREGVIVAQLAARERPRRPQFMEQVLACLPEAIAILMGGGVMYSNPAFSRMFGYAAEEIAGEDLQDLIVPETRMHEHAALERLAQERGSAAVDTVRMNKRGEFVDVALHMVPLMVAGTQAGYVLTFRDIGERKQVEACLQQDATRDVLTGLPNRMLFRDRLQLAMRRQARRKEQFCGVLLLDVDGFRAMHADLGHAAADQLLIGMAQRLEKVLRPHDTAARLGEDDFAILAEGVVTPADMQSVVARVFAEFEKPISVFGNPVQARISIGAAMALHESETLDQLIANAEIALRRAKQAGGYRYEIFDRATDPHVAEKEDRHRALRNALAQREFAYLYQPFFRLQTGQVEGFQMLLRGHSPALENCTDLLAAAESAGLSVGICREILEAACRRLQQWNVSIPAGELTVTVPVTRRQLYHETLVQSVEELMRTYASSAGQFMLEIPEAAINENPARAGSILQRISHMGARISLCNFGRSVGALQHLVQMPVTMVKIDAELTKSATPSSRTAAVLEAILHAAKASGIATLAQGVEREEQFRFVQDIGFELVQGNLLSEPLKTEHAEVLAARSRSMATATRA